MAPRFVLLILFSLTFLVRCSPQVVVRLTPTETIVPTIKPSPTIRVSSVPLPTANKTATKVPTLSPIEEFQKTQAALKKQIVHNRTPQTLMSYPSPDGRWQAEIISYPCLSTTEDQLPGEAYDQLYITNLQDQEQILVADLLMYCTENSIAGLGGFFWSPNSRFFYYTDARDAVPEDSGSLGGFRQFYRYDTANSLAENLGCGAVSPDQQKIATFGYQREGCQPGNMNVWDVDGQSLVDMHFQDTPRLFLSGLFTWSEDSQRIAMIETQCAEDHTCLSAVSLISLADGKQQVLVENHQPALRQISWKTPDQLRLVDEYVQVWLLTVSMGTLKQE